MDVDRQGDDELGAGFDLASVQDAPGDASGFTCPECGGALWETEDEDFPGYTCHVGHSYSADSMLEEQGESVERALWGAVRILEERKALVLRLAQRMEEGGQPKSARMFSARAREAGDHADVIRRLIEEPLPPPEDAGDEERGRAA